MKHPEGSDGADTLARLVATRWSTAQSSGDGAIVRPGCDAVALDAFEAKFGVLLPRMFRALYELSDGTASPDAHLLSFYPIGVVPHYTETDGSGRCWVGFADYASSRSLFLMRFADGVPPEVRADLGSGTCTLEERAVPIADSFDAFLQTYLQEPEQLIVHAP